MIKKAQSALLLVVFVQVLGAVYLLLTQSPEPAFVAVILAIAALYVGLWAWCKRNPLAASTVGLVFFVVIHIIEAVLDPSTIMEGIVIKLVVTAALIWGVANGLKHRELVREQPPT